MPSLPSLVCVKKTGEPRLILINKATTNKIGENNLQKSDYVLTIETDKTGLLDIKKLDNCYKYGYEAVSKKIEEIKQVLSI